MFNKNKVLPLFKRELTDIFRDKKTLFMMVVLPVLLYPMLLVGMSMLFATIAQTETETVYKVAVEKVATDDLNALKKIVTEQKDKEEDDRELEYTVEFVNLKDMDLETGTDMIAAMENDAIDAALTYDEGKENPYIITYQAAKNKSVTARVAVETLLDLYNEQLQVEKMNELSLDEKEVLHPIRSERNNISSKEEEMGNVLGGAIPMMIIVSIMMGAMYPAIDVTAGEKERGTLETLLTLPVTNFEMIMSKFMAVAVIACVTAILNILSMGAAFAFVFKQLGMSASGTDAAVSLDVSTFIPAILFSIVVMLFFALFMTAVSMCVCIFAKSYKEANNYVTPVMLVFMFASLVTMVPNIELNGMTATIPVVNISLMIMKLFSFTYDYATFGIVLLSNVVYSLLAVMLLSKIYSSEEVLFAEGMTSLKIFNKRSEMKPNQIPGFGDVILLFCLEILAMFYIGGMVQIKRPFFGTVVVQLLILIIPMIYLWYLKGDFKKVYSLKVPKIKYIFGALFTWVGTYSLVMLVSLVLSHFMQESAQHANESLEFMMEKPMWMLVVVVALMPAIGEELLCRGFFMGSLKSKMKPIYAMLISSALFGLLHMNLLKFFTTGLLGFAFAMVVNETGVIFMSMLMHFTNNFFSVLAMKKPELIKQVAPVLLKENLEPMDIAILAVVAVVGLCIGYLLIHDKKKEKVAE